MSDDRVDAIILAGGAGTRIAPVLGDVPKALAPVHGRPFLAYLIDQLAASGRVGKVVVAAGHGAERIIEYVDTASPPIEIAVAREPEPLGTGGALLHALATAEGETLLALNGDSFCELDITAMLEAHRAGGAIATIAAVRVEDARRYGSLILDADRVIGFAEKSTATKPAWINAGTYVFERRALRDYAVAPLSLEFDVLPKLVAAKVTCHKVAGRFIDIGTPASYAEAERILGKTENG